MLDIGKAGGGRVEVKKKMTIKVKMKITAKVKSKMKKTK